MFYEHSGTLMQCPIHQSEKINTDWEAMCLMHAVVQDLLKSYLITELPAGKMLICLFLEEY